MFIIEFAGVFTGVLAPRTRLRLDGFGLVPEPNLVFNVGWTDVKMLGDKCLRAFLGLPGIHNLCMKIDGISVGYRIFPQADDTL